MNTKTMKILVTVLSAMIMVAMLGSAVFALTPGDLTASYEGTDSIQTVGQKVMGIIQTVGIVVAVVILMVLGIKYMMGSAEEKADYKKTMIPYIIGAACIFLAPTIANMLYSFLKS